MRTKVFIVFAVLAAFVVLAMSGCATYGAKGLVPDLNNPSSLAVKEKMTTKMGEGLIVTMYPITTKEEVDKYFDEDLMGKEIVPIFVKIQNEGGNMDLIAVTLGNGNGNTAPSMTASDLYAVIKRDWIARSVLWTLPTFYVGGPVSAAATYYTNTRIKEDFGVEGDGGKLLKLGKILNGSVSGFLCFRYSQGGNKSVKLIFQKEGRLIEFNFDIG